MRHYSDKISSEEQAFNEALICLMKEHGTEGLSDKAIANSLANNLIRLLLHNLSIDNVHLILDDIKDKAILMERNSQLKSH